MPTTDESPAGPGYGVRPPMPEDAPALGALHCRVWRETYADLMAPDALARLDPDRFAQNWAAIIAELDGDGRHRRAATRTRVAVAGDELVGFITVGPARDDDAPAAMQLWAINIVAEHQGTGLGDRLMSEVLGPGPAYLWVADRNDRAISFYRRHGFVLDGTASEEQDDGIREVRMVRDS
jgi:ribosomal protein S18 acetylase RimI-like enzyme